MDEKALRKIGKTALEVTAKSVISQIPIGGALINNVWGAVQAHSLQKRQEQWRDNIEQKLSQLNKSLEELGNNEIFVSAVIKGTEAAIKTAEAEKREYLANAVLHSVDTALSESVVMIYMDLIERYTLWHIKILHYFKNPAASEGVKKENYYMGSVLRPLFDHFPNLQEVNGEVVEKILNDLVTDGMLQKISWHTTMTADGMLESRTTQLGSSFIDFITQFPDETDRTDFPKRS